MLLDMETDLKRDAAPKRARMNVLELVEALGCGPAQLQVLVLGPVGVHFCDGAELSLVNIVAMCTAAEFGLNASEKASLSVVSLLGFMLGTCMSGYLGDHMGRKLPIVLGYAVTSLFGFVCAACHQYGTLLCFRLCLGCGMGLGFGPGIALVSEITPIAWRMKMRVCQMVAFACGGCFVAFLAAFNDATLVHLQWRYLFVALAVPPAVLCVLSCIFLPESPVWLASIGERSAAEHGFEKIKCKNGFPACDTQYLAPEKIDSSSDLCIWSQLRLIFSSRYGLATCTYLFVALVLNLLIFGDQYAAPQILTKISTLEAGWQCLVKGIITVAINVMLFVVAEFFSPSTILALGLIMGASACLCLSIAGSTTDRSNFFHALIFQFGTNFTTGAANWGFAALYQLCVELYTTTIRTSGTAVVIAGGRLAAISAPMIVEMMWKVTGSWQSFYYYVVIAAFLAVFVSYMMQRSLADASDGESTILSSPETTYGVCRSA